MNDKKKKLFVRVLCFILALIMVMGLVIQVAFAEEGCPYEALDGFEFVSNGDGWDVVKTSDKPVIRLSNVPEDFVNPDVTVLVANLDTNVTQVVHLFPFNGYTTTLDIDDGYYLIYTNEVAWKSTSNNVYAVNNHDTVYFYYGDSALYDSTKYQLPYILTDNVIDLPMVAYNGELNMSVIEPTATYHRTPEESGYPLGEVYNWDILADLAVNMDWEKFLETGEIVLLKETDVALSNDLVQYIQKNPYVNESIPEAISNFKETNGLTNTSLEGTTAESANGLNIETAKPEEIIITPETKPAETTTPQQNDIIHDTLNEISENVGLGEITYKTPGQILLSSLKSSWFLIVLLFAAGGGYLFIKNKNEKALQEQLENDMYDDGHIE